MKIQSITAKSEWESYISSAVKESANVSFFQSWNWGDFEQAQGVQAFRWVFTNDDGKSLLALAQGFLINAKRGRYLHLRNGPIFINPTKASIEQVTKLLAEFARELKCTFFRISPLVENNELNSNLFINSGYKWSQMHDVDAEVTWVLDLQQDQELILKSMRDSHRYLVRKALKMEDLEIVKTDDINMVKEFWPIYEETFKRQKWTAYSLGYLEKEFASYAKDDRVMLFLAKYQGKFIAASMFIYYQGQAYYHHSGSLTAYRNVPAMYKIHWESILEAKQRGCTQYNFFGIARDDNPKHPWAGLTLFKKGFGGSQKEWLHALDYPLATKYWLTHYYEKIERKRRGY